ncbi:MAG: LptA/OstA family protein [Pseudomonadota bacterium]
MSSFHSSIRRIMPRLALTNPWPGLVTAAFLSVFAVFWHPSDPARAQTQDLTDIGSTNSPLEIDADEGLEWRREEQVYIARGNAKAANGEVTVKGDVLSAHYRPDAEGKSQVFLLDVQGNVIIETDTEIAYGDHGQYVLDEERLELRGEDLKLVNKANKDTITARDSLEYWRGKQIAVARGNAEAFHEDKQIRADVLSAHFKPDDDDKLKVFQVVGEGNVEIRTATDFASGKSGVYYVAEDVATLSGDVKITQKENQLNGEYAEVNLATGVSKILGAPPGGNTPGRVQGLVQPNSNDNENNSGN